jgi:REP element-mobilizing transposase RayT
MPYARLFYHFVWATQNRLPLITAINREPLYNTVRAKVTELGGVTYALNGIADHVHLVATVPPKIPLATFMGQVKSVSAHLASRLSVKAFAWQQEYGVLSVSESHLPTVVRYVVDQQQRHAEHKLDDRLERWEDDNLASMHDGESSG